MRSTSFARFSRSAGRVLVGFVLVGGGLAGCADSPDTDTMTDEVAEDDLVEDEGSDEGGKGDAGRLDSGTKDGGVIKPVDGGGKDAAVDGGKDASADGGGGSKVDAGGIDSGVKSDASVVDGSVKADAGSVVPDAGSVSSDGELCHLEGHEVGVMGDSYIDLSGDFTNLLQDKARAVKALDANETYVDHSLSGASMSGEPNIPAQFEDVQADSKMRGGKGVKVVIMDGGGNDVLIGKRECLNPTSVADVEKQAVCVKVVDDALASGQKLFDEALAAGVKGVVFFFYPHLPKDSLLGGPNANNVLDYSLPRIKQWCDSQTKMPCHFIDMRAAFDDPKNPGWPRPGLIAFDGIHPTLEGSKVLADEVWKVMQNKCIAVK